MKIEMLDKRMAELVAEGYLEDGVRSEIIEEDGKWLLVLNDKDYKRYQEALRQIHDRVLQFAYDWDSTNQQSLGTEPPADNERRLGLYLVDVSCKTAKGFKVTSTLSVLMDRKTNVITCGSKCEYCGKPSIVVIQWENVKGE